MITLLRKLVANKEDRMIMAGMVVIAANAGGAFSPIGDVTTTMLWIGGQISTVNIMLKVFMPAIVSMVIPLILLSFQTKGTLGVKGTTGSDEAPAFEKTLFLILGVGGLVFVPVFKTITHLPPYVGMLFVLSILWATSEVLGRNKPKEHKKRYSIYHALEKIDIPTVLFFLGILLAVAGLQSTGLLGEAAAWLDSKFKNETVIVTLIGLLSAIVDNVPLVAASMGMYSLEQFPMDHSFWELLAYCAGTGGSALIIGSAAGVAVMGMEKISFFWYMKKITWLALAGYFAGILAFLLL
jgi:Na+/H+ antiporter NhaD/arsenite permease-like protein